MYMSAIECTTTYTKNDDNTSTFTITMNDVCTKCMETLCADPEEYIKNAVVTRSETECTRIYRDETERHLENGTMPAGATKKQLVLAYTPPEIEESV
jgi:hypothetical protein